MLPTRLEVALAEHRRHPNDAYWCLRLCEACGSSGEFGEPWPAALACVLSHDPSWFVEERLSGLGALGVLEAPWPALTEVENLLSISDASLAHYVKGRIWSHLYLRHPPPIERLRYAADHLLAVDERHRTHRYYEELAHVLDKLDYAELKAFIPALLGRPPTGISSTRAIASIEQRRLGFVLVAAARAGDWEIYDTYRQGYHAKDNDPHYDCKVANADGLRELAAGREQRLPAILEYLTKRAANLRFLGAEDDTSFVEALIKRGQFLGECRRYLEVVAATGLGARAKDLLATLSPRDAG